MEKFNSLLEFRQAAYDQGLQRTAAQARAAVFDKSALEEYNLCRK